ncbi:hypothetical protein WA158_002128 [Blastocystis sp. Blastoise]
MQNNRIARPMDREKTCPFLLRTFIRSNQHFQESEFTIQSVPSDCELDIHTWKDATIMEILTIIRQDNIDSRRKNATIDILKGYFTNSGQFYIKKVGSITSDQNYDKKMTLDQTQLRIGDFLLFEITFSSPI